MRCTGPYTRVFFDKSDARTVRALVQGLRALDLAIAERHVPQGTGGLDDFAFDVDFPDPAGGDATWEFRAAKYQGPKKLIGRTHVYDAGLRRRTADGAVTFEGHVFDTSLKRLGREVERVLPRVLAGERPANVLDRDDAELHRIELCTGLS